MPYKTRERHRTRGRGPGIPVEMEDRPRDVGASEPAPTHLTHGVGLGVVPPDLPGLSVVAHGSRRPSLEVSSAPTQPTDDPHCLGSWEDPDSTSLTRTTRD